MILRQTIIRNGRRLIPCPANQFCRTYATDVTIDNPIHRQSERDHQPLRTIRGHPDDPSSLLDAAGIKSTPRTLPVERQVDDAAARLEGFQGQINSLDAAHHGGAVPVKPENFVAQPLPPIPFSSVSQFYMSRKQARGTNDKGSRITDAYYPWTILQNPPRPSEVTLPMLLANQCHLGHATALWHPGNSGYIYGVRDGIHIISLEITLSYLRRAAKIIEEVAYRGGIILFIGTRKNQREIIVNAAKIAEPAYHIFSRWIPGSLTNGQQILEQCAMKVVDAKDRELEASTNLVRNSEGSVLRPDLVVCMNPIENEVCLHECGLYNVPTIGIVDTNVNPAWVTYPIPANDDSLRSVALISGVLARAAQTGQQRRIQVAEMGKTTYNTTELAKMLQKLEEAAGVQALPPETAEEAREKRKDANDNLA